jgi:hypothetical protein
MSTLPTLFKEIYGEALKPLGFKKVKGRQPYFVRMIGDEILQVVTFTVEPGHRYTTFTIKGGVATVYRPLIDLTINPCRNSNWLVSNLEIYRKLNPFVDNSELFDRIYRFSCGKDEESMLNEVKYSLDVTTEIMIPMFDKITDFEKCIENSDIIGMDISIFDDENFGVQYPNNYCNEGLLLIKANNRDDFVKRNQNQLAVIEYNKKIGRGPIPNEKITEIFEERRIEYITKRDNIYNNPNLYKKALSELERRKAENIETLKSYGLM